MAGLKAAVASGNWSNPATWNDGILPVAGDTVASNGFTVTIDQNVNVDSLTNAATAPVRANPIMTSNTTPSGIASASSEYDSTRQAWKAFDGSSATTNTWIAGAGQITNSWLAYEFATPTVVTSYTFAGSFTTDSYPKNFTFEGWNGSTWTVLHTVTGNTSTTYTGTFTNTTAYIKYRIYITLNGGNVSYLSINEMYLYDAGHYTATTIAGGGFILNSGVTVRLTGTESINQGTSTVLTVPVTAGNTSTLIANNLNRANVSQHLIVLSGAGTFNVTGTITYGGSSSWSGIYISGVNSTLNFNGSVNSGQGASAHGINTDVVCTINIVGSTIGGFGSNTATGIRFNSPGVFTLVGTTTGGGFGNNHGVYLNSTTATITGDVYGGNNYAESPGIQADNNANITITGIIYGRLSSGLRSSSNIYLNHYGSVISTGLAGINGSQSNVAISSTGAGAINILTGPFISSPTGIQPIYLTRMHYRRTSGSYYEFRDNSTNGALPPATPAPATRLVAPSTAVDAPSINNVRYGVTYASGSLTGTMRVPSPANVRLGVGVDNTVGTAVLTVGDIWNYATNNMTISGSIGDRLKNSATVASTGDQISNFIS